MSGNLIQQDVAASLVASFGEAEVTMLLKCKQLGNRDESD